MSPAASALTLGTTTPPTSSSNAPCSTGTLYIQSATDSSYQYSVPAGAGTITSWSTNTAADAAGTNVVLVVLRPSSGGYTVVAVDSETIPTPLPSSGVATFNLTQPIAVAAGDTLGLWSASAAFGCAFIMGSIPAAEVVSGATATTAPSAGAQYTSIESAPAVLDVSANLAQAEDAGVTAVAAPSSVVSGSGAAYGFTVTTAGPGAGNLTFTDAIPSGLKIIAAAADSGTCTTSGQTVTCTIGGLPAGGTAQVWIIVSTASAGSYPDSAAVTTLLPDPTPADNSATATLTVTAPPVAPPVPLPSCKTLNLAGAPLASAKALIPALNCSVGKTTKKSSKKIRKGFVISTSPGPGKTLAHGTKVNIVVSSGPPKKKKKKK
jgi:hypothetical protein